MQAYDDHRTTSEWQKRWVLHALVNDMHHYNCRSSSIHNLARHSTSEWQKRWVLHALVQRSATFLALRAKWRYTKGVAGRTHEFTPFYAFLLTCNFIANSIFLLFYLQEGNRGFNIPPYSIALLSAKREKKSHFLNLMLHY